jgi:RNA polymerase sigma factor (sigma-70 family)
LATRSNSRAIACRTSLDKPELSQDAQLVAAAKTGRKAAFGELCERHSKKIFRAILCITRNREDAEDALQDSYLNAFVHLGSFDGRSSFSTWFTRIAINSALMTLRKNRTRREISIDEPADAGEISRRYEPADAHPDPEELFAEHERERIMTGAVRELRPTLRQVIEIRRLQEFSMKETARMLGISVTAAKSRLFHARAALGEAFSLKAAGLGRDRQAA